MQESVNKMSIGELGLEEETFLEFDFQGVRTVGQLLQRSVEDLSKEFSPTLASDAQLKLKRHGLSLKTAQNPAWTAVVDAIDLCNSHGVEAAKQFFLAEIWNLRYDYPGANYPAIRELVKAGAGESKASFISAISAAADLVSSTPSAAT